MSRITVPTQYVPSTCMSDPWIWADQPSADFSPASGKWLVFVYSQDVDRWWSAISAEAVARKLGPRAKVATALQYSNPAQPRIICVYTRDWADTDDVRRVLIGLRGLGIDWRLSYKTDDATLDGRYSKGTSKYVSQPGKLDFDVRN